MSSKKQNSNVSELWNEHRSFKDSPASKLNDLSPIRKLSPRNMTSSALAPYSPKSPSYHQNWENALNEVLGVLRIQYRNEDDVMSFLSDPEKLRQLQFSTAAKMEWNRRVIKEELDSGMHCPTRSRRIAKEVAIDYVRRYVDGEEERVDMVKKIQALQTEKDNNLTLIIDLERDMKRIKEEKNKFSSENAKFAEDILKLQDQLGFLKKENDTIRDSNIALQEANERLKSENLKLRDENMKLRIENQDVRSENAALRAENQKVRHDNDRLRKEAGEIRTENGKIREENQLLRAENLEVRSENTKLRESDAALQKQNEQFLASNDKLLNENKSILRENLELLGRTEEVKSLVKAQMGLLERNFLPREQTASSEADSMSSC